MTTEFADPNRRMAAFARTFPSVANADGVSPWDATVFDHWAAEPTLSHGELVTARFLLAVWNPDAAWVCGQFDLMNALGVWDGPHRAAFLAWAEDPWWP